MLKLLGIIDDLYFFTAPDKIVEFYYLSGNVGRELVKLEILDVDNVSY